MLLVETVGERRIVARHCDQADAAGVSSGMTLAQARALLPTHEPVVEPLDPAGDAEALRKLAQWALRFSPVVALDPPDGLLLDITGCQRVFRGEDALVHSIALAVRQLGFPARVASAPTFGCAWAVARFHPRDCVIVPEEGLRAALAPLPIAALRFDEQIVTGLWEVGVERIGELAKLSRASLRSRFGEELLPRLDRATGQAFESIEPVRPVTPPLAQRLFDGPTTRLEAIETATRELLDILSEQLQRRESGARRVEIELGRIDADPQRVAVTVTRPTRDPKHLWTLIQPRLERANLGYGVESVTVTASRVDRLRHRQTEHPHVGGSGHADTGDRDSGELLDVLVNRLGPDRVTRVAAAATHLPERVFRHESAMDKERRHDREMEVTPGDRPSVLLERPERIEVVAATPDGPASWLRWRGLGRRVTASLGPERIAPEWWNAPPPAGHTLPARPETTRVESRRDYFKISDEFGQWLWIYHERENGGWFVHGIWA